MAAPSMIPLRLAVTFTASSVLMAEEASPLPFRVGDDAGAVDCWACAVPTARTSTNRDRGDFMVPSNAAGDTPLTVCRDEAPDTGLPPVDRSHLRNDGYGSGTAFGDSVVEDCRGVQPEYVANVFDKRGETDLPVAISADLPSTRRVAINQPRTIGFTIGYSF